MSLTGRPKFRSGTKDRVRRDLCLCTADGTAFSIMVGIGENYFAAFVLALGMGEVFAGWITTVPMLAGSLLQLVTPLGVRLFNSYRTWVSLLAAVQALSFVPLVAGAFRGGMPEWAVFVAVSLYWFGGLGGGPAWSTWMSLLIPSRVRAPYFAGRTRWCQAGVVAGILFGGTILKVLGDLQQHPQAWPRVARWINVLEPGTLDLTVRAFAVLFGVALACRGVSSVLLMWQSEPRPLPIPHRQVSASQLLARVRQGPDGRFLAYVVSVGVAGQLAQPFFSPFILAQVKVTGSEYSLLLGAAFLGRILALPALGRMAHAHGPVRVLWVGAWGLLPVSLLWLVSDRVWWLVAAQVFAGAVWAAHELGVFLMYFETIREDERTSVLTKFNLLNSLSMAGGTVLGGWLLEGLGGGRGAYAGLFVASVGARAATLLLLRRVRPVHMSPATSAAEIVAAGAGAGVSEGPILPETGREALPGRPTGGPG